MTQFGSEYFKEFKFTAEEIEQYLQNAFHDLEIARKDPFPEVRFTYSFQALIKGGISLIAKMGNVKVRSIPGHHAKILEKLSEILNEPDILTMGNVMRKKRNTDLYGGGDIVSEKETSEYFDFVEAVLKRITKLIKSRP